VLVCAGYPALFCERGRGGESTHGGDTETEGAVEGKVDVEEDGEGGGAEEDGDCAEGEVDVVAAG
jgi:hypothetical protein